MASSIAYQQLELRRQQHFKMTAALIELDARELSTAFKTFFK